MRQNQQQNHRDRMNSLRASSGAESLGNNRSRNHVNDEIHTETGGGSRAVVQPTPLFERLVTEEVQELKTYAGIVERQNVELAKQKKVQEDLEARLRGETRRRKELESMLEEQERVWSEKFVELEGQRTAAEKKLLDEQTRTKKLINQVQRKDRDIHEFFKKKVRMRFRCKCSVCFSDYSYTSFNFLPPHNSTITMEGEIFAVVFEGGSALLRNEILRQAPLVQQG